MFPEDQEKQCVWNPLSVKGCWDSDEKTGKSEINKNLKQLQVLHKVN